MPLYGSKKIKVSLSLRHQKVDQEGVLMVCQWKRGLCRLMELEKAQHYMVEMQNYGKIGVFLFKYLSAIDYMESSYSGFYNAACPV